MTPSFANIIDALNWWQGRDQLPLAAAVTPPCDVLGDEVYDVMLAVFFKHLVGKRSAVTRFDYLKTVSDVHGKIVEQLATVAPERQVEAQANATRIKAMLAVVDRWTAEITDAVSFLERRSA